ncbi:MAG: PAS domain S-box protein [Anaerolineales bacterium]|nr:PAS domain S-box protein [Anaerolineales bacterium]
MTNSSIHVLLVEDNPTDVLLLREALAEVRLFPFELTQVAQLAEVQPCLNRKKIDVILLDLGLPDSQGLETLLKLRRQVPQTPVVVLTGLADEELGLKALQAGAQDYLVKGQVEGTGLARSIRYAIERQRSEEALRESEAKLRILFNLLPVGVSVLNAERNVVETNLAQERILHLSSEGLSHKAYLHRTYLRADGTPMPPEEFPSVRALAENRVIEDVEIGIVTAAGERIWTNVSAAPVHLNDWQVVVTTSDLSWRKWAEESLKQSEAFNRAVLNSLTDHVAVLDREGNITAVNRAWENFARANGDPTLVGTGVGLNYLQICREAAAQQISDAAEALAGIEAVLSGAQNEFYMEYPCHSPGQERYFLMHISPLSAENGGVVISHLDITARRQAQAEIQRRNRELVLLNQVIAVSASNGDPESFLETVCWELVQAFDLSRVTAILFEQENTEIVVVAEAVVGPGPSALNLRTPVKRNPVLTYLLSHEGPLEVADVQRDSHLAPFHELAGYYGVGSLLILPLLVNRKIVGSLNLCGSQPRQFSTEEINLAWSVADQVAGALARAQMVQVQQRLSTAVEQSEQSVIITDTEGNIIYVNPAFERNSGYSQAEVLGQNPRLLKSNQHDDAFYARLWATISAGQVWRGQFVNKKKNGVFYTEEASITPVRDENGVIVSYVGLQRDVTHELQLEEQYRQAQKMEAIGRLSGGVAHDFNNLLVVINGYSELLLNRHLDTASPFRKYVEEIIKAGERAAGLTQQLLAFSRKQVLQPKVLNLNETVAQTEKMLRRLIGEDIDFVTHLEPGLGEVKADPGQIEQIILNLGVNARDAMPRGGKLIIETDNVEFDETYISQHAEVKPGHYVMLTVSDTGLGMDAATKARIFEPFFTTKDQGRGTGLGLATVYGIVKQSGGDIWVYSEVGRGTTFKVYLPRVDEVMPRLEQPVAPVAVAGGDETVLLVEDEMMVRTLARQVLELRGYTVLEAEHGQAALRLAQQHPSIHLLLTDLIMPGGLTGRELAEQLEPLYPEMKVLYMSGYTDDAIVHYGVLTSGVHFCKTFHPAGLERQSAPGFGWRVGKLTIYKFRGIRYT